MLDPVAIPLTLVLLVAIAIIWMKNQSRIKAPIAARRVEFTRTSDGVLTVPVRGLESRGRFSRTKNGMRPTLQIVPGGLRYKIFRETEIPFNAIGQVDAQKGPFGGGQLFVHTNDNELSITVSDLGIAKAFLAALPPSVPLSREAALLRDGPTVS
jgi:hypothetical protein